MNREGNKLSAAAVNAARKPGLYGDGHGLYLQISKYGTKSWVFRYMLDGVARKMGMGALHTVSLAEARKRAAAWRLKVHDGVDPIDERKAARSRQKVETARAVTFKECADRYIEANRLGWENDRPDKRSVAEWLEAQYLGSHGKLMPVDSLVKMVGISRDTVRTWRKDQEYKGFVKFAGNLQMKAKLE